MLPQVRCFAFHIHAHKKNIIEDAIPEAAEKQKTSSWEEKKAEQLSEEDPSNLKTTGNQHQLKDFS